MLSFFKRKDNKIEKTGQDSSVNSVDLLGEATEGDEDREVSTSLSFHPSAHIGTEEKYYFQFLNNELPPLKPNQISLSGIELKKEGEEWHVIAFIRNSLPKAVKFEETPLLLTGPKGEILGRKIFQMKDIGELPAESSRPWIFVFQQSDLLAHELPTTGWKLAFELKSKPQPHRLDFAESWVKSLKDDDKQKLEKLVDSMQPPKPGEVNFMGLQAIQQEDGDLHVTMLVRNGSAKNINLQQLPLIVEDANGEVIAKGGFALEDFEVKANTSKPWTFIFPKELVLKEQFELSRWKAYPPQK